MNSPGSSAYSRKTTVRFSISTKTEYRRRDLNPRPRDYDSRALPTELRRQLQEAGHDLCGGKGAQQLYTASKKHSKLYCFCKVLLMVVDLKEELSHTR